jgi:L-fucose isomerase-like protein
MGMLTEEGVPAACEADVPGTLTSLLLQDSPASPPG